MEKVVKHYAAMGIKGFKVDFMDRDDQEMVDFMWKAAEICASHKMLLDYHAHANLLDCNVPTECYQL